MAEVFNNTWGILGDIRFQPESAPRALSAKRLQEAMRAAQPMFLGVGQGRFNGYYVIESLGSTVQSTLDTGEISSLSVKVELMETLDKPESKGNKSEPYVEVR